MGGRLIYLMGPSGSGKDSLIDAARKPLLSLNCEVARRVITRSAESVGEDAHGVSMAQFERLRLAGEFALCWQANGLSYGIPVQMDQWLKEGRHVLVNGSRAYLPQALARYPTLLPIMLTVDDKVLRQRLLKRGREAVADIDARLARNTLFESSDASIMQLDNSGNLADTVAHLLDWMKVNVEPDRT
ncbi:phosphonate metabolism protein/1,5-bisphosphokinase (PRPP-forming) PhnN [Pseudomonas syringae]|nr:phosphonate metabolism protein/1,5-bisphosphokinase (PRPP-forming) PhnN [Pseudomonas syringae]MCF5068252.1 phosphonate metabolism protein/1,5-bisphosphokinase (PRPP-forming) PhnN [Pseudomonas syringae]